MKIKSMPVAVLAALIGLSTFGLAMQAGQKYTLEQKYVQGGELKYSMNISMEGAMSGSMSSTIDMKVLKLLDNGSAEMSIGVSNATVTFNGNTMNPPESPAVVVTVDKYGAPIGDKTPQMQMTQKFGGIMGEAMKDGVAAGETVKIDQTDAKSKAHVWGTVTCTGVKDGLLGISEDLQMTLNEKMTTPMHVVGTEEVDPTSHVMVHTNSTVTNVQGPGGMTFSKIVTKMDIMK